jgi:hypothetical protein
MKVKDTNLINLQPGDVLMYRAGALLWPDFDVLGNLIKVVEGNKGQDRDPNAPGLSSGDYTHCAWVRDTPDPEAEVEEVQPGVFKVMDGQTWIEKIKMPTRWEGETETFERLCCKMGTRVHSTWPVVKQESIDWENPHAEIWRIRNMTPAIAAGIIKLANDMIGWKYDLAEFLTIGALHLPSAKVCSRFISDIAYNASMLLSDQAPMCLTPDISGNEDKIPTPNDLVNSGWLYKVRYQGILGS